MLRVLIGSGLLLMVVGFGAAGWQYWQGLPPDAGSLRDEAALPGPATAGQGWLITPGGSSVPGADVSAFLVQDRFVSDRRAVLTVSAALQGLLVEGEQLPERPYLQVLADIRALKVAETLCPILTSTIAEACAVDSARVIDGSVDPVSLSARFRIELVYRQKLSEAPLPDLASHVLRTESVLPFPAIAPVVDGVDEGGAEGGETAAAIEDAVAPVLPESAEAALASVMQAIVAACADRDSGEESASTCRLLRLNLDWAPGAMPEARAEIAWLDPLPDGMTAAPSLEPLPEE